jgi:hypothetical protein
MNSTREETQNVSQQYLDAFMEAASCLEQSWRTADGYLDSRQRKRAPGYNQAITNLVSLYSQVHKDQHEALRLNICEVLKIFGMESLYKAILKDVKEHLQEQVAARTASARVPDAVLATL